MNKDLLSDFATMAMTDGYGDVPENPPEYPMLWVLTSDGQPPAEWGWRAWLKEQE